MLNWYEQILMIILYVCMVSAAIVLVLAVVIIGCEADKGVDVVKNIIGCIFFAGCSIGCVACFVGVVRA